MTTFLDDNFLLESDCAVELYHGQAKNLPIIDFHCHLSPAQIAGNHRFRSMTELWLDGDHYKWRAMRTNGEPERFCAGDGSDWEKFAAWARTVPDTLRSPLYHWAHMELRRPFGIDGLLSPATARTIFDRCNACLSDDRFTTLGLLETFRVAAVCTTDDPTDALEHHRALAARPDPVTRVFPTWRPDKVFAIENPAAFNEWIARLERASGSSIGGRVSTLMDALTARHTAFHDLGCRLSDHGLETLCADEWTDAEVDATFDAVRRGAAPNRGAAQAFKSALVYKLALLDHSRGWVQQFHLGALRNNNTRLLTALGPDTGFDSIGDFEIGRPLSRFLDRLDVTNQLAKTVLYNLNPRDNAMMAAMIGNFQDGSVPGKIQYGSAWWFLDQLDGMRAQMDALSNMGLLSRFVGMVTDSRSFLSYSRHEYFRRLLCHLLGDDVRRGLLPDDRALLGQLVRNVSFFNARNYFGLQLGRAAAGLV